MKINQRVTVYTLLDRGSTQREIALITGIDRKTVRKYQRRWLVGRAQSANSPGVATGPEAAADQINPRWPPAAGPVSPGVATSLCEPHRDFIEAQLRLKRNAAAIYQDLSTAMALVAPTTRSSALWGKLRHKAPEQFDRLSFLPGEEM